MPMGHPQPQLRSGATAALSNFIATLHYDNLKVPEQLAVKRHLLDTLGAAIAGSQSAPAQIAAVALADLDETGTVPVPGRADSWSRLSAAYLMGASAHGLELDDGFRAGSVHPGAPVIPAVLAAAWGQRTDGRSIAGAICVGYEVVTRLAAAAHPASRNRGFHNTSIAGVFGAAAAVARLYGFDARRCEQTLGIAASSAAGLFAFLRGGGEIKRLHPGMAAREGLFAAHLARRGMTGPHSVLEIEDGFLQAFANGAGSERIAEGLGGGRPDSLNITRCYLKPYACCRHIHPALDAIIDVVAREQIAPRDIETIHSGTYAIAAEHGHGSWSEMASAQMSYQFCTATAALRGRIDIDDFKPEALKEPDVLALCRKVTVGVNEQCQKEYPNLRSAHVAVTMKDGRQFKRYIDEPSGSARHPMSDGQVQDKFDRLAAPVIGAQQAAAVRKLVWSLDTLDAADQLLTTARPAA